MQFRFRILNVREHIFPQIPGQVFLSPGDWDDYSFKTSFNVLLVNREGKHLVLGTIKIGYANQPKGWTLEQIPQEFDVLPPYFFSLGQDVKYYKALNEQFDPEERTALLSALRDVAQDEDVFILAKDQTVFVDSLTRGVSASTVKEQFRRVLHGQPELTDFNFAYIQEASDKTAPVELDFQVKASSTPSTNLHVLIGRNGIGKTTLLNNMISTLMGHDPVAGEPARRFVGIQPFIGWTPLPPDYFSSVVSVSFSAFDTFLPPKDRQDRTLGPGFFYIGMKHSRSGSPAGSPTPPPKTSADLISDFTASFKSCLSQPAKRARWLQAVHRLESDANFADMSLGRLLDLDEKTAIHYAGSLAARMSSGHSIVLLTITRLVDTVEEKTLVLVDEPESHLHPPLLSAFTRALSDLLHDRNGVAIIATHSPVVLQEVPKSCVWKLTRIRTQGRSDRPERETFGENVGVLTREVFGLEVSKSGFHEMLEQAVEQGNSFDQILRAFDGQLGTEAKAILLSLLAARDSSDRSQ